MNPLVFSLTPLIHAAGEAFELGNSLSASSRPAEPPCGIPCALIEQISLTFIFSRYEAQSLENGVPTEHQLLETLPTKNKFIQKSYRMPKLTLNSTHLYDRNDCPELYRNSEKIQDVELLSLFNDDTYNLPPWEDYPVDISPRRSIDERQTVGPEAESMSLGSNSVEFDSRCILRLAHAGMKSVFCKVGTESATGVLLSNEATGLKLSDISPALFSPGYSRVGFYNFELGTGYRIRARVTIDRYFHTIIIFFVTSPMSQR